MAHIHPSDIEGYASLEPIPATCEICGIGEVGIDLERFSSTDAVLCAYCVETLVREWKNNKHIVRA